MKKATNEKRRQSRKWKRILFYGAGILVVVFSAYLILNKIIENKVKEKLGELVPFAKVGFSSIHGNAFASSFSLNDLSIKLQVNATDSIHQHTCNFSKVEFNGINFFSMLFNEKLSLRKLKLRKGKIKLDTFLFDKNDSLKYALLSKMTFKNISIAHFEMEATSVWLCSNEKDELLLTGLVNMDGIEINHPDKHSAENNFHFTAILCNLQDIDYTIEALDETLQIKQLSINSKQRFLKIDSLKIISNASANAQEYLFPV